MDERTEKTELEQIADLLQRTGAKFVVIGGQAENLHGSPRVTYDVDLCYLRTAENLANVAAALRPLNPRPRNYPAELPFVFDAATLQLGCNFTFKTSLIDLDLLGEVEPIGNYEALIKKAKVYVSHGVEMPTIDLDELLRVKKHINRMKDQESIMQITALVRRRDEGKTARN